MQYRPPVCSAVKNRRISADEDSVLLLLLLLLQTEKSGWYELGSRLTCAFIWDCAASRRAGVAWGGYEYIGDRSVDAEDRVTPGRFWIKRPPNEWPSPPSVIAVLMPKTE